MDLLYSRLQGPRENTFNDENYSKRRSWGGLGDNKAGCSSGGLNRSV